MFLHKSWTPLQSGICGHVSSFYSESSLFLTQQGGKTKADKAPFFLFVLPVEPYHYQIHMIMQGPSDWAESLLPLWRELEGISWMQPLISQPMMRKRKWGNRGAMQAQDHKVLLQLRGCWEPFLGAEGFMRRNVKRVTLFSFLRNSFLCVFELFLALKTKKCFCAVVDQA